MKRNETLDLCAIVETILRFGTSEDASEESEETASFRSVKTEEPKELPIICADEILGA